MGFCKEGLFIAETRTEIETACEQIPRTIGVDGGIICTGFIDVEKILKRVKCNCGQPEAIHFFLEKKLPFQVVFIAFADENDCSSTGESSGSDSSGDESSGCESGESSGSSGSSGERSGSRA